MVRLRQNQHLLIHRAPTLYPGPYLVFLDPAKKGLRYPNLKSKTSFHLQSKLTVTSTHQSLVSCCQLSQLMLICPSSTLLTAAHESLINLCLLTSAQEALSIHMSHCISTVNVINLSLSFVISYQTAVTVILSCQVNVGHCQAVA